MNTTRSILHIVNQSPFDKPCLEQCLQHYTDDDAIIFLENGVYSLLSAYEASEQLKNKTCYAIAADVDARGLNDQLNAGAKLISFNDFVHLCTEYDLTQSWY